MSDDGELIGRLGALPPDQLAALFEALGNDREAVFTPLPGPQTMALDSAADETLFGGSAGGSKSYLLLGCAATQHRRSLILRRQSTELDGLIADLVGMLGSDGFNASAREHVASGRSIKLGGMREPDDWRAYAGRARDFMGFDEAGEFLEEQVASLLAWLRSTDQNQRCRAIFASNPPRGAEGEWLLRWFAPWLDPGFPDPAPAGELRWYVRVQGETRWVAGPGRYEIDGETYTSRSRTFIPARLSDNPYLDRTGYRAGLENLPEPLRSQLLKGDFLAGREDDSWQVIPSDWIAQAQARWQPGIPRAMSSLGVDVAQGGADNSVLSPRHGVWFAPLRTFRGVETPNGPTLAAQIFVAMRDNCIVVVDCGGGHGGSAYDHLRHQLAEDKVIGFIGAEASQARTADGRLGFGNKRAEVWWKFREALDPETGASVALPPDPALVADLSAPRWRVIGRAGGGVIQVELKTDIIKRLGRSPDRGDAVVMSWAYGTGRPQDGADRGEKLQTHANVGYARAKPWAQPERSQTVEIPGPEYFEVLMQRSQMQTQANRGRQRR